MIGYGLRRLFYGALIIFLVTLFVFFALRLIPGDPVRTMIIDSPGVTEDDIARRTAELGLDKPVLSQLFSFLGNAFTGDLGKSFYTEQPVTEMISDRLPVTLQLGAMALTLGVLFLRSSLLEVLGSNYIRTVRAKGAGPRLVLFKHATRNSLIPVFTILGLQVGAILGGTVILETIFSIPGMGTLIAEGVRQRDYPVVMGSVIVFSTVFILVTIIVDLLYGVIDPRVRYQ